MRRLHREDIYDRVFGMRRPGHEGRIQYLEKVVSVATSVAAGAAMPRITLNVTAHTFPAGGGTGVAGFGAVGGYDNTIYAIGPGPSDTLKLISPGVFLVTGVLYWENDWGGFADMQLQAALAGSGSGGIFTGGGTRTQTGTVEGISGETNFKEVWAIYEVLAASDASNYVSAYMSVRNQSGADRSSTAYLRAMRLTGTP